jgi:signal transduction histidine kinase
MEMIAGKSMVSSLVVNGAHLVTPGWLSEWQRHIAEWGFTRDTARDFFAECSRQIVLLNTGISKGAEDEIAAFSDFVDRPFSTVPLGLDLMQVRMQMCREQWRGSLARQSQLLAQRQFSDYAMAFDLLSTLVRSVDEIDVVQQIINLYQMLFAASDAAFIHFSDGQPTNVECGGFGTHNHVAELYSQASAVERDFSILPAGNGFLLKVQHGCQTLGVVWISGIALPEHLESYLNLAMATIGVCGLALHNARSFREIADKNRELEHAHSQLKSTHMQLLQQEKMASIGQLAAGVAHEINNPMGFITSNLGSLQKYVSRVIEYLTVADRIVAAAADPAKSEAAGLRSRLKIDYVINDTQQLIEESLDGATRVKNIVNDLKNLSRADQSDPVKADLNSCLQSALNIACNEIKYNATIEKQFGELPETVCHPQQLSQVFINLLTNAAQAMEGHGIISIRTWSDAADIFISVADTGLGIPEEIRSRIFDPFFTTKEVGKGTGLGLSISYDILQKHGGDISVESTPGQGSTFLVRVPVVNSVV